MTNRDAGASALAGKRTAFIGAGFMGESIIRGLLGSGAAGASAVIAHDPAPRAIAAMAALGAPMAGSPAEAARGAEIVVLAVKPQAMEKAVAAIRDELTSKTLVISIAAGISTSSLELWLGHGARVVRAMPNMAASAGHSATAICAGRTAGEDDMAVAMAIFDAVGKTVRVDETLMDAVTGLSGSGPAYVFMFLEGLIDAGVSCGLPRDSAALLARQTLMGAAALACEPGAHPSLLKERITSPGGTTIAALSVLESEGFRGTIMKAARAAMERSRELGGK